MAEVFQPLTLSTERFFRHREEFTLLGDKVRVEWRKPMGRGMTEVPLRFLDPTWAAQSGSGNARYLSFGLLTGAVALCFGAVFAAGVKRGEPFAELIAPGFMTAFFILALGWQAWSWRASRFNVLVFTSLHPQYGGLVIPRDPAKELDVLQFADAVSERIRIYTLTKPEG